MDNDFGSPGAVAAIFETVRRANLTIDEGRQDEAAVLVATVVRLAADRDRGDALGDDDADIDALVEAPNARKAGDFTEADRIRGRWPPKASCSKRRWWHRVASVRVDFRAPWARRRRGSREEAAAPARKRHRAA